MARYFIFDRFFRERFHGKWMLISLVILLLVPVSIGLGLYYKSSPLLSEFTLWEIISLNEWKPLSGKFGLYTFILSSFYVTIIAILIAAPICLLAAIYITQYSRKWVMRWMLPVIDILAGIPSVVYGVWGILLIVPFVSDYIGPAFGIKTSGYTILSGAIVLSVMIIPYILNVLIELFNSVPHELKEASLSLGANMWQTTKFVLLKKTFPGIISAIVLGIARAFGETIAVLMVVGNTIKIPESVLDPGYPLPALIANNYGEMLSIPKYESALMLSALVLFIIVLLFNLMARLIITRAEKSI